jgi:hypothetical protein
MVVNQLRNMEEYDMPDISRALDEVNQAYEIKTRLFNEVKTAEEYGPLRNKVLYYLKALANELARKKELYQYGHKKGLTDEFTDRLIEYYLSLMAEAKTEPISA